MAELKLSSPSLRHRWKFISSACLSSLLLMLFTKSSTAAVTATTNTGSFAKNTTGSTLQLPIDVLPYGFYGGDFSAYVIEQDGNATYLTCGLAAKYGKDVHAWAECPEQTAVTEPGNDIDLSGGTIPSITTKPYGIIFNGVTYYSNYTGMYASLIHDEGLVIGRCDYATGDGTLFDGANIYTTTMGTGTQSGFIVVHTRYGSLSMYCYQELDSAPNQRKIYPALTVSSDTASAQYSRIGMVRAYFKFDELSSGGLYGTFVTTSSGEHLIKDVKMRATSDLSGNEVLVEDNFEAVISMVPAYEGRVLLGFGETTIEPGGYNIRPWASGGGVFFEFGKDPPCRLFEVEVFVSDIWPAAENLVSTGKIKVDIGEALTENQEKIFIKLDLEKDDYHGTTMSLCCVDDSYTVTNGVWTLTGEEVPLFSCDIFSFVHETHVGCTRYASFITRFYCISPVGAVISALGAFWIVEIVSLLICRTVAPVYVPSSRIRLIMSVLLVLHVFLLLWKIFWVSAVWIFKTVKKFMSPALLVLPLFAKANAIRVPAKIGSVLHFGGGRFIEEDGKYSTFASEKFRLMSGEVEFAFTKPDSHLLSNYSLLVQINDVFHVPTLEPLYADPFATGEPELAVSHAACCRGHDHTNCKCYGYENDYCDYLQDCEVYPDYLKKHEDATVDGICPAMISNRPSSEKGMWWSYSPRGGGGGGCPPGKHRDQSFCNAKMTWRHQNPMKWMWVYKMTGESLSANVNISLVHGNSSVAHVVKYNVSSDSINEFRLTHNDVTIDVVMDMEFYSNPNWSRYTHYGITSSETDLGELLLKRHKNYNGKLMAFGLGSNEVSPTGSFRDGVVGSVQCNTHGNSFTGSFKCYTSQMDSSRFTRDGDTCEFVGPLSSFGYLKHEASLITDRTVHLEWRSAKSYPRVTFGAVSSPDMGSISLEVKGRGFDVLSKTAKICFTFAPDQPIDKHIEYGQTGNSYVTVRVNKLAGCEDTNVVLRVKGDISSNAPVSCRLDDICKINVDAREAGEIINGTIIASAGKLELKHEFGFNASVSDFFTGQGRVVTNTSDPVPAGKVGEFIPRVSRPGGFINWFKSLGSLIPSLGISSLVILCIVGYVVFNRMTRNNKVHSD